MVKWWNTYFDKLKEFDILSYEEFLDLSEKTLYQTDPKQFIDQKNSGRVFLGISSFNLEDPKVRYYHDRYNPPNAIIPSDTQIVIRQYQPEFSKPEYFTKENRNIFDGQTTNVNSRDGFIVSGHGVKPVENYFLKPVSNNYITGEWIYLTLPYHLVYDHMLYSINNVPLEVTRQFIVEIDQTVGWESIVDLKPIVEKYDKLYPNWNHDFPILGFRQFKLQGMIFPCMWWHPYKIATEGTHKMVMAGFNKLDIPYLLPVPKANPIQWTAKSKNKMFFENGNPVYLCVDIDRELKKVKYYFKEN
jgi:hypothetical protein